MWLNQRLAVTGPLDVEPLQPFFPDAAAKKEAIRDVLISQGASPEVADQVLNAPEMRTLLADSHKFDTYDLPHQVAAREAQTEHMQRLDALETARTGRLHLSIGLPDNTLAERAVELLGDGGCALHTFAERNVALTPWIVMASQLALQGPLKAVQGLAADFVAGETVTMWVNQLLARGLNSLGLASYDYAGERDVAASALTLGLSFAVAGPKSVLTAAKGVYQASTRRHVAYAEAATTSSGSVRPTTQSLASASAQPKPIPPPVAPKPTSVKQRAAQFEAQTQPKALLAAPKTVRHHLFNKFRGQSERSQKYRDFFKKHEIDVDAYSIEIPETFHRSKIHVEGNNWTTKWKNWIDSNPNASTKEVYQFAGQMMDDYGVSHVPIVKY